MKVDEFLSALDVPLDSHVNQRVPKKMLVEHGARTAADRRCITDGIDEVRWLAALKPTTIGVPIFCDDEREYLEIAVLSVSLRSDAKASRLAELIHRAVPYPVFLVVTNGDRLALSVAHKRWSQREAGATVLDGELVTVELSEGGYEGFGQAFTASLAIGRQPRGHLFALYQGWMNTLEALLAARVTGAFVKSETPEQATARREALRECARLDAEIARLRAVAAKEKQVARQVELNLELKLLECQWSEARQRI